MDELRTRALERLTTSFGLDAGLRSVAQSALRETSDKELLTDLAVLEELKVESRRILHVARQRSARTVRARPTESARVPELVSRPFLARLTGLFSADMGIDL